MFEPSEEITNPKQRAFLAAYAECGTVTHAAVNAGINRRTHTNWMDKSAAYRAAFDEAKADVCETFETEARRRAVEGVRRYLYHNGKPVIDPRTGEQAFEMTFSDTMLIFLLKAADPEKYRERRHVNLDADVSNVGKVQVMLPHNGREDDHVPPHVQAGDCFVIGDVANEGTA